MLKSLSRKLVSPKQMARKIIMAKKVLSPNVFVIARTHSLIAGESLLELQGRIDNYTAAGADIICVHYTKNKWSYYQNVIDRLKILKPLMVIFSKFNFVPKGLNFSRIRYILFPNQIYRLMMRSVIDFKNGQKKLRQVLPSIRTPIFAAFPRCFLFAVFF
jgi:2-methylisocitrate lyase-like PEP mutase family enzyme